MPNGYKTLARSFIGFTIYKSRQDRYWLTSGNAINMTKVTSQIDVLLSYLSWLRAILARSLRGANHTVNMTRACHVY